MARRTEKTRKARIIGNKKKREAVYISEDSKNEASKYALRHSAIPNNHRQAAGSACGWLEPDDPVHVQPAGPDSRASPAGGHVSVPAGGKRQSSPRSNLS